MKQLLMILLCGTSVLMSSSPVLPGDRYYITEDQNLSYVFTQSHQKDVPSLRQMHRAMIQQYTHDFGYRLDDTLYVGIASLRNQIANGFSTQMPFNAQLNYPAGGGTLDYFSTSSWIKTLLIHETAHNYQLNAKENIFSKYSHKIVGNIPLSSLGPIPLFPLPNVFIGSFLLEGNAVLNESRFGIGGRLFSGYALAQNVLLAGSEKFSSEELYNSTLSYPYAEKWYLVGGQFQAFLAQKYGIDKVNQFFKAYSEQFLPFAINGTFEAYYGKDFETLLGEFKTTLLETHKEFQRTKNPSIAHSQFFVPLNSNKDEIFTLISDAKQAPKLLNISKKDKQTQLTQSSLPIGRVFKENATYYTQSTRMTSAIEITQGLYDDNARLLAPTASKVIQGFTSNGEMVYIDLNTSLDIPHIYKGDTFYDTAHSRVFVDDEDNLYYFKQINEKRVLYKNKKRIVAIEGHYGYVCDVDAKGGIYFIATSNHGTTVYRYKNKIIRVTQGDDVVDMKLTNEGTMLLEVVRSDGFDYLFATPKNLPAEIRKYRYSFENSADQALLTSMHQSTTPTQEKAKPYNALAQLKYSALDQTIAYNKEGLFVDATAVLSDPLMQNNLLLSFHTDPRLKYAGIGYHHSAYRVQFGANYSYAFDKNESQYNQDGYRIYAHYPLYHAGYWKSDLDVSYLKPIDDIYTKVAFGKITLQNKEQYGISKYPDVLNDFSMFIAEDRGTLMYGATYSFMHHIWNQSYVSLNASARYAQDTNATEHRGISLDNSATILSGMHLGMEIPTLENPLFAKEIKSAEVGLYKVFDASMYFFSFPLSLQRESLYLKHTYYDITSDEKSFNMTESTLGLSLDILVYHSMTLPFNIELVYNQDTKAQTHLRFSTQIKF